MRHDILDNNQNGKKKSQPRKQQTLHLLLALRRHKLGEMKEEERTKEYRKRGEGEKRKQSTQKRSIYQNKGDEKLENERETEHHGRTYLSGPDRQRGR
jgi:hypothetical protein